MSDGSSTFLQGQVMKLCDNTISTCPFTDATAAADCTHKFCYGYPAYIGVATCPSLNLDPDNCCASDDPVSCLDNYAHGSGLGGGSGSGSGSASSTPNVCASVITMLDFCFSATPTLSPPASALASTSGPSATALAGCLCYDSDGTYDPDTLDNFASECAASGSAAHPTYFPLVTPFQGFCTHNAPPQASAAPHTTAADVEPSTTPSVASSTAVKASSADSLPSATPSDGSTSPASAAGTITSGSSSPSSTPSGSAAQTTTSPSTGVRITLRNSAVLLLAVSIFLNFG